MAQAPKGKRTGTVQQVESKDGGVQFEAVKEIEEETIDYFLLFNNFLEFLYLQEYLLFHLLIKN